MTLILRFVKTNLPVIICFIAILLFFSSCETINVYEKDVAIPKHNWPYDLKPTFSFDIKDTVTQYNLYIVLRHTDAYNYNNIWVNLGTQAPGDSVRNQRFELALGSDAKGWEGTGMGDIWEVRKSITRGPFKFNKPGMYNFTLGQIMRENPLPEVMSVGMRVEKVK